MMSRIKKPAQAVILMLALLFIFLLLRSQWQELRSYEWRLQPLWLLPSALAIFASWSIEVHIWRSLLHKIGGEIGFGQGFRIWFISALVRYIPGNIWQPLGMTVLARQQGVRAETTVTSIALYQAVNLLSAAVVAALYLPLAGGLGRLQTLSPQLTISLILLLLAPVIVFIWRPQWLIAVLNRVLRKLGRPAFPGKIATADILRALLWGTLDWTLLGVGFAALTLALYPMDLGQFWRWLPHMLAGYPLAYAIGYLSFITPSGLAVREGVLYVLLTPITGGAVATVAALAMRVWLMLCELTAAAIALATWPQALPRPWQRADRVKG